MHDARSASSDRPALISVATAYEAVERLRRALGSECRFARCSMVAEARALIAEYGVNSRIAALLVEPKDARGAPTAPLVREVRSSARLGATARVGSGSAVPIFALVHRNAPWCAATVALIESQPSLVLIAEDLDVCSVVRSCATRLRQADFVRSVWGELEPEVPIGLRPLVHVALARADEPISVQLLAEELGLHRKTLWSQCRRHGLGTAQALMTWCRLLAAEHALRNCSRPVDSIAEELAFASPTALRNAVRRHLRTTPSALRASPTSAVREGFVSWLRGLPPQPAVTLGDVA